MSDYPKTHTIAYAGRRLDTAKKILHAYQPLDKDCQPVGDLFLFKHRIQACYGIGTFATLEEAEAGKFMVGAAKYADIPNDTTAELALAWRAKDEVTMGTLELARKSRGEDVWFEALDPIKRAYQSGNRGARAVIVAKLIQYLETP